MNTIRNNILPFILNYSEVLDWDLEAIKGTFFYVNFQHRYFICSLKHVFGEIDPKAIRLNDLFYNEKPPFEIGNKIIDITNPKAPDETSPEDLFIIEFYPEQHPIDHCQWIKRNAYMLFNINPNLSNGDRLYAIGHPANILPGVDTTFTNYDDEVPHTFFTQVTIHGKLDDVSDLGYTHRIILDRKLLLGNMSGSPVFKRLGKREVLAGILNRGGNNEIPSEYCYFIDSAVIFNAIRDYTAKY